jgi:peptidoglycan/xylan/chitin deacetylase (PgdA/CDA1 family)
MQLALTLDDAPSIMEPGVPADPRWMDEIREKLVDFGVTDCVAFVIGERAIGHESVLRRWLAAGYELGNHTFRHEAASRVSTAEFLDSVRRCDQLLQGIGAFDRGQRWFRFPYLDRGANSGERRTIQDGCSELGYRVAHASVDLFDHSYDRLYMDALSNRRIDDANKICQRYRSAANAATLRVIRKCTDSDGRISALIPYAHFGAISSAALADICSDLIGKKIRLCTLEEAMADPIYADFDASFDRTGLVSDSIGKKPHHERVLRRLVTLSQNAGMFSQSRYGPLWPHLH